MTNLFFFIGIGELIFVFLIIMLIFGPKKIPILAKDLGTAYRKIRFFLEDIKNNINESVEKPLKEEISKIDSLENSIKRDK